MFAGLLIKTSLPEHRFDWQLYDCKVAIALAKVIRQLRVESALAQYNVIVCRVAGF